MLIDYATFSQRADALELRLTTMCLRAGRDPKAVVLLPVTKTHPAAAADHAFRRGFEAVGENRVLEAVEKQSGVGAGTKIRWELIGHLQSNKAKMAAQKFDRIQSADSEKLILLLDRAAGELNRRLPILIQINAGFDPAKFGADPADAGRLVELALSLQNLRVDGLMTIAPLSSDPDVARRTFTNLRTIRDDLVTRLGVPLNELSMGMSGDLDAAVEAGSTLVRIGTALYGARE